MATDKAGNNSNMTVKVYDNHAWDGGVVTKALTAEAEGKKTYIIGKNR